VRRPVLIVLNPGAEVLAEALKLGDQLLGGALQCHLVEQRLRLRLDEVAPVVHLRKEEASG
jgi:hypothetical protein